MSRKVSFSCAISPIGGYTLSENCREFNRNRSQFLRLEMWFQNGLTKCGFSLLLQNKKYQLDLEEMYVIYLVLCQHTERPGYKVDNFADRIKANRKLSSFLKKSGGCGEKAHRRSLYNRFICKYSKISWRMELFKWRLTTPLQILA